MSNKQNDIYYENLKEIEQENKCVCSSYDNFRLGRKSGEIPPQQTLNI